jgi:U32 family peptidase
MSVVLPVKSIMNTYPSTALRLPELLLPAGSFDAGLAALEGGADAVYLGFSEFSARRQARNFGREEYRRILRRAHEDGKRVYVTVNTVILESELQSLAELFAFLDRFPPDAILFQDWGVAAMLRARFPGIALHASTQMAIQSPEAARLAHESGVSRVVLPRECGLADLKRLKKEVPELEYEVFVHGALCYSFSGLCLASGLLLGRSANRGECAQVCRSYYRVEEGGSPEGAGLLGRGLLGREGYWFSCRDLDTSENLQELAEAGAASLKVEGRMKAPEYSYAVARLYRAELDRLGGAAIPESALEELRAQARIAFSRRPTKGYLLKSNGEDLLDAEYPGHRGVPAGKVISSSGPTSSGSFRSVVELSSPLGLRDGLLALRSSASTSSGPADLPAPLAFGVTGLADAATGRPLVHARSGGQVEIDSPEALCPGEELSRVSAREYDRRALSPEEYEPELFSVPACLSVELADDAPAAAPVGRICLEIEAATGEERLKLRDEVPLSLFAARSPGGFEKALSRFAENGDFDFRFSVSLESGASVQLDGKNLLLANLFIPPSELKAAKNRLYEVAARALGEANRLKVASAATLEPSEILSLFPGLPASIAPGAAATSASNATTVAAMATAMTPPRALLSFPCEGLKTGLPYATPRVLAEKLPLPVFEGKSYLPLSPLVADWPAYADLVRERVRLELDAGRLLVLGLDALHHVAFARELFARESFAPGLDVSRLSCFGDIHLYVANRLSQAVYSRFLPRLDFSYEYLELPFFNNAKPKKGYFEDEILPAEEEADAGEDSSSFEPPEASPSPPVGAPIGAAIGPGFEPPLFISRGCFIRHHLGGGSCPPSCAKSLRLRLADRGRRYVLLVEDCITMLFREVS